MTVATQTTPDGPDLNLRADVSGIITLPRQSDPTTTLLGYPFTVLGPAAAAHAVLRWAHGAMPGHPARHVHLANAYTLALADTDDALAGVLRADESVNLIDGTPLAWVAASHGAYADAGGPCRGPQLFHDVLEAGSSTGTRHYLLGGTRETLDALEARIAIDHPSAVVAGTCSPPFRALTADEKQAVLNGIRAARPDIVWVGLGTPKQDFEARQIAEQLGVMAVAVGAAFDFAAGLKPEAPAWLRGSGLEWTYRLVTEPRRLWRRYLFGNARFLAMVSRHLISRPSGRARLRRNPAS